MNKYDAIYYEPAVLNYPLGKYLKEKYNHLPWFEIKTHNRIEEFTKSSNCNFSKLKQHLILGVRKTHRYTPNEKVSNYLVPFTSSGCRAMCLYCYLVCNYNKCSYLRVFVNREEMLERLIAKDLKDEGKSTYEIGSNSDLVLENEVTNNLTWIIENFVEKAKGKLTFPTKFHMIEPLLTLNHQGRIIFRMSVNPEEIIKKTEFGTSSLKKRIEALNKMAEANYPVGLLIAPVIMIDGWQKLYCELIDYLQANLSNKVKSNGFIEIILMTYTYIHHAINSDAFPNAVDLLDKGLMKSTGYGRYGYTQENRAKAEALLVKEINEKLDMPIIYIS